MVAGVRAGRPNGGSGGLEAYAFPFVGFLFLAWLVRRLGPALAQRISRTLVGEESPLEFANKGKLKGKPKRGTAKGSSGMPTRSPAKKPNGSPNGSFPAPQQEDEAPAPEPAKPAGAPSFQELSSAAPLALERDEEAVATAQARMESVEWTVQEGKRPKGGKAASPRAKTVADPPPAPSPEPKHLRFEFEEEALARIARGLATHEARIQTGVWKKLSAGDVFVAHSPQREVTIEVAGVQRFASFGEAWAELGAKLVPAKLGVTTPQLADDYFAQRVARPADAKLFGVVALRLQVIFEETTEPPAASWGEGSTSDAAGGAAGGSSSSADACALPPSQGGGGSEGPAGGSGGKGKAPYRRPAGGKAPAGKAPRESD